VTEICGLVAVRMASKRLPRKAFLPIGGRPILQVLVDRLRASKLDFVVCTTTAEEDKEIESWCAARSVPCFRGDEENVLARFVRCLETHPAEYAVRITGDNPFTDFDSMWEMFPGMKQEKADYARQMGVPLGAACEIARSESLRELLRRSRAPELSEYMTYFFELAPFIKKHLYPVKKEIRMPELRLTIDYEADLRFANALLERFHGRIPTLREIVAYCRQGAEFPRVSENAAAELKEKILFS
jgi:spore coat polysaccharide biosynthesis protein SpsF